jgi:hypothetical protein
MSLFARIQQYFRKFGLMSSLTFDQQVWGAKSVIDLAQFKSQFLIAQGPLGGTVYTCWMGSKDKVPTAVTVDSTGHATGPFPDSSHVQDCVAWTYPPKVSCAQAVANMAKAGITEPWTFCTLKKVTGQKNPTYNFQFASHAPVTVDAATGKIL